MSLKYEPASEPRGARGVQSGERSGGGRSLLMWRFPLSTWENVETKESLNEYDNPGPCLGMAWADTDNPVC